MLQAREERELAIALSRSLSQGATDHEADTALYGLAAPSRAAHASSGGRSAGGESLQGAELESALPQRSFADAAAFLVTDDGGAGVECAVCLSTFRAADAAPVRLLPCMHVFHCGCIDPWLARSVRCPTCKERVL